MDRNYFLAGLARIIVQSHTPDIPCLFGENYHQLGSLLSNTMSCLKAFYSETQKIVSKTPQGIIMSRFLSYVLN